MGGRICDTLILDCDCDDIINLIATTQGEARNLRNRNGWGHVVIGPNGIKCGFNGFICTEVVVENVLTARAKLGEIDGSVC